MLREKSKLQTLSLQKILTASRKRAGAARVPSAHTAGMSAYGLPDATGR